MTKSKQDFIVTDIDKLAEFAPGAVVISKKPLRGMINNIINAGITVPGIQLFTKESVKAPSDVIKKKD